MRISIRDGQRDLREREREWSDMTHKRGYYMTEEARAQAEYYNPQSLGLPPHPPDVDFDNMPFSD